MLVAGAGFEPFRANFVCLHSCGARHFLGRRHTPSPLPTAAPTLSPFIRHRRRSKALLREPVGRRFTPLSTQEKTRHTKRRSEFLWLRGPDLNRRPPGYEPDELPGCSTPRYMRFSAPLLWVQKLLYTIAFSFARLFLK